MDNPFDSAAKDYQTAISRANRLSGRGYEFFVAEKARILRSLVPRQGGGPVRILDVGCGVGALHAHLVGMGAEVIGVDVSRESIAIAERANPGVAYIQAPATSIPLRGASVDMTCVICVLHHIVPGERDAAVAEMARLTRPGGVVAIIEHHPGNPYTRYSVAQCPLDDDATLLRRRESEDLLQGAGIAQITTRYVSWTPFAHRVNESIERLFGRLPFGAQYVTYGIVPRPRDVSP